MSFKERLMIRLCVLDFQLLSTLFCFAFMLLFAYYFFLLFNFDSKWSHSSLGRVVCAPTHLIQSVLPVKTQEFQKAFAISMRNMRETPPKRNLKDLTFDLLAGLFVLATSVGGILGGLYFSFKLLPKITSRLTGQYMLTQYQSIHAQYRELEK